MPYSVRIPREVKSELVDYVRSDMARRREVEELLEALRVDPHSGEALPTGLEGCLCVELHEYRLYYFVDDEKKEVRTFRFHQYWHNWEVG